MDHPSTPTSGARSGEHEALQFERLVFFSDAVFAIAITLLVIEVKVPVFGNHDAGNLFPSVELLNEQWPHEFIKLLPKLVGYVISFLVIGQYWIIHHRNFGIINRQNRRLLWLNLLFLMSVAFIPFTTGFYSEYLYWSTALSWCAANIAIAGLLQWTLWRYASKNHRLIDPETNLNQIKQISMIHLAVPIAFGLAFVGGLFGIPFGMAITWVVIPIVAKIARQRFPYPPKNTSGLGETAVPED